VNEKLIASSGPRTLPANHCRSTVALRRSAEMRNDHECRGVPAECSMHGSDVGAAFRCC
jgi:hypothetical protein